MKFQMSNRMINQKKKAMMKKMKFKKKNKKSKPNLQKWNLPKT